MASGGAEKYDLRLIEAPQPADAEGLQRSFHFSRSEPADLSVPHSVIHSFKSLHPFYPCILGFSFGSLVLRSSLPVCSMSQSGPKL